MSVLKVQNPPQTYSRLFRPWDSAAAAQSSNARAASSSAAAHNAPACSAKRSQNLKNACFHPAAKAQTIKTERLEMKEQHMELDLETSESAEVYTAERAGSAVRDCSSRELESSPFSESYFSNSSNDSIMYQQPNPHHQPCASTASATVATSPKTINPLWLNSSAPSSMHSPQGFRAISAYDTPHPHHPHPPQAHMLPYLNNTATTSIMTSDFYYAAAAAAAAAAANNGLSSSPTTLPSTSAQAAAAAAAAAANYIGMDPYHMGIMEHEYARILAEEAQIKAINARKQRPKKFKCPHCDVAFSNNGQLKGHIRIHTGERPFKCDVESCGKTFTRNEELTRHKRIHTGLRPYPCSACGKKFGRRDHLKKHMKTHMPQERQLGTALFVPMYPYLYGL